MIRKKMWFSIGIICFIAVFCYILTGRWMESGKSPVADGTNEYAIVLGAKVNGERPSLTLQYRLEAALSYAEKHPDVIFVLSGGQGPDEGISEAEAMRRFLTGNGISEERLLLETNSTSTYENLTYSKELLPKGVKDITIISSDFHLARAKWLADSIGLSADVIPAKTPLSTKGKHEIRERLALMKTYVVGH